MVLYMGDVLVNWFAQYLSTDSTGLLHYLFNELSLLTQTIISTLVILSYSRIFTKSFFSNICQFITKVIGTYQPIFFIFYFQFFSGFVIWISDFVLKTFFKTKGDEVQLAFTKVELGNYISEQMESVEADDEVDSEIIIFQNALEFSEVKAREAMVPRTELTAIEIHDSIKNLSTLFTQTGHSKIVVFKNFN